MTDVSPGPQTDAAAAEKRVGQKGGVIYQHRSLFIFSLWNVVGWQRLIQCVLRLTVLSTINLTIACSYM